MRKMISLYSCGCAGTTGSKTCPQHGRYEYCSGTNDGEIALERGKIGKARLALSTSPVYPRTTFDFLQVQPIKEISLKPNEQLVKCRAMMDKKHFVYVNCPPTTVAPTIVAMELAGFKLQTTTNSLFLTEDSVTGDCFYHYGTILIFGNKKIKIPELAFIGLQTVFEKYLLQLTKSKKVLHFDAHDYRMTNACKELKVQMYMYTKYRSLYNFILNPNLQMRFDSKGETEYGIGAY